jgi:hypothetical protein
MLKELIPAVALILLSVGCATIREVKKQPGKGGVIMVQEGVFGDARSDAGQVMKENCRAKKPVVVEEGEVVVGSSTTTRSSTTRSANRSTTEGSSSSDAEDKREWRITYKCKGKSKAKRSAWYDEQEAVCRSALPPADEVVSGSGTDAAGVSGSEAVRCTIRG